MSQQIGILSKELIEMVSIEIITSHLKKVFWPNIRVGHEFQILEIQQYSSGLKFMSAVPAPPLQGGDLEPKSVFKMACSYKKQLLYFLMVLVLFVICFAADINADDKRKGFIGDLGIGFAYTELGLSSGDGKADRDTSNGPCFSARVGYGFNEQFFLYASLRESSYFNNKWVNDDIHHGGMLYGLGLSYFIDDSPNSLYITAAYGIGDLDSGGIVDKGKALLFGAGYLTASHFAFEFSFLNLSVKKDDIFENDFDANSYRFLVRYLLY